MLLVIVAVEWTWVVAVMAPKGAFAPSNPPVFLLLHPASIRAKHMGEQNHRRYEGKEMDERFIISVFLRSRDVRLPSNAPR
jgi:hypothetical protein